MVVSTRLARTDRDIHVTGVSSDSERRALIVLANWASECMGHHEMQALHFAAGASAQIDDNIPSERIVAEIGTALERAGKPALAGLADLIFAQALAGSSPPGEASRVFGAASGQRRL